MRYGADRARLTVMGQTGHLSGERSFPDGPRQILGPRGETGYPFRKGATRDIRLPRAHRDPRSRRLPRPRRRIRCRPQGAGLGQGMAGPDGQRQVRGKLEWRLDTLQDGDHEGGLGEGDSRHARPAGRLEGAHPQVRHLRPHPARRARRGIRRDPVRDGLRGCSRLPRRRARPSRPCSTKTARGGSRAITSSSGVETQPEPLEHPVDLVA